MLLTLINKKGEAGDAVSFIFKPEKKIVWLAGQYMFYTLPNDNPDNRGVTRYFTISSAPFEKDIMITTRISKLTSSFKKSLVNMKIGKTIEASGPDGDFTLENPDKNYAFIAGGIGITPFRSILLQMNFEKLPINVQLLYANSNENIVFKEELKSLKSKNPNFKINYFISPNHINEKILSTMNYERITTNYFVSGPEPFVESIEKILKDLGVEPLNIKLDHFPGYETSG